ncbi:hypothetical protein BCR35DRAFT_310678 [Leucosporidium creatinivorum]|uniref:Uncharacterized protein n=1 Tax=Leucosporidium creatinivorum TaxID=106004 RepID=A0A1Y2CXK4_9BASI|nr:hypothetical protein BCR35DRAFT_310678 [Leucosporidium creatinivorum]
MLSQLALVALAGSAAAQLTFSEPTITLGSGPEPPSYTGAAPSGTWAAPQASVTVGGTVYAPPSMTGIGKQAQIIGADNFCLYMPPDPTTENLVEAEAVAVAYCFNPYNDTRPMPDGFITTAHFRNTSDYVQVTGTYDWTRMNLNPYDCGGEYDNHGAEGVGNPVGAHIDGGDNWAEFMGGCDTPGVRQFCIRSCHGDNSYPYCRNTFDLGCLWTMPGDYTEEGFTNCQADSDLPIGVYNSSYTFSQGMATTPTPVVAPSSSQCVTIASPTASGVTYSWMQMAYATGVSTATSAPSGSGASTAKGTSSTGGSTPASGASSLGVGIMLGAGVMGVGMLVGGVLVL